MKVAVLLAAPWVPGSVDMTEYIRVLREQGHEAMLICMDYARGNGNFSVEAADRRTLESASFYRNLNLDAAIAFTWINSPEIVAAMKEAGMRIVLRGDCDGMISVRHFPRHYLRVRLSATRGIIEYVKALKHWTKRFLLASPREDRARITCIELAHATVLETVEARRNVAYFLRKHGRYDLTAKLHVVPHFVSQEFLTCDVSLIRQERVVCVGRWDDAQKNAPLLARTIEIHLTRQPETSFQIIGPEEGRAAFTSLMKRFSQVEYLGPRKPSEVRLALVSSKVLLSSSRWEGSPVVANEALACGTTVVGTPIPAFLEICGRGFGTVARNHTAGALARALDEELRVWDRGLRDPAVVSAYWRPRLWPNVVVGRLSGLLSLDASAISV